MPISGENKSSMQAANRALALNIILRFGAVSRSELAVAMGLTPASISKIIGELVDAGVVTEKLGAPGQVGRRRIELSLVPDYFHVIAVKLARKYFVASVFNLKATIIKSIRYELPSSLANPSDIIRKIKSTVSSLLAEFPSVKGIGIAVPGPYLKMQGQIALMSEYTGWETVDFQKEMSEAFPIPVVVEHDCNASAYAEYLYGSSNRFKTHGTLLSVLCSEGVGAGVIEDGVILRGAYGTFGEIGHMSISMDGPQCRCGNRGCLESYCSAAAFAESVARELPMHPESSLNAEPTITEEVVFLHMQQGDAFAIQKVRELGRYLGIGISNAIYLYNPEKIIIADEIRNGGPILLSAIRETIRERTFPVLSSKIDIYFSRLGEDPTLIGAAAIATSEVFKNPRTLYRE